MGGGGGTEPSFNRGLHTNNASNLLSLQLWFPDIQLIGLAAQRKLNFFINFKQRCLFVLMYANAQGGGGGERERGCLLQAWWRSTETWEGGQVRLISESAHLVIESGCKRPSALIRDTNRRVVPGDETVRRYNDDSIWEMIVALTQCFVLE